MALLKFLFLNFGKLMNKENIIQPMGVDMNFFQKLVTV